MGVLLMRYDSGWTTNSQPHWKRHGYASEASYRMSRERYNEKRRRNRQKSLEIVRNRQKQEEQTWK